MKTQADSAAALRRSLDPTSTTGDGSATPPEINHPSLSILRSHLMVCERCPVGAPCHTGDLLRDTYREVQRRIDAAQRWEVIDASD